MDKENIVYLCDEILFSHKKGWNTERCYNKNKPWRQYAVWKNPDKKDHMLYEIARIEKFIWSIQYKQIQRDKTQIDGC